MQAAMKTTPRTPTQWWEATRNDPTKLNRWLQRQLVGETAAVNLLSELLIRFGSEATSVEWETVHKVMQQEALHASWMHKLLRTRGLSPEPQGDHAKRYWAEVLPNVTSWREAMAAGFHAERMRLERIRVIASDPLAPPDVRATFKRILPHEEWHEQVFDSMRQGNELTRYHERGLQALNLTLI